MDTSALTPAQADAEYALLCLFAEDMYTAGVTNPPADPRLAARGWTLKGWLVGFDTLMRPKATMALVMSARQYYGFWATHTDGRCVAVVRGTMGFIEWIEDAQFSLMPHPKAGKVEAGFYGVYDSFMAEPVGAPSMKPLQALPGNCIVVGHSLGAAIATYLALDLALAGDTITGRFFASPHPGDTDFAQLVAAHVGDHRVYAYALDIVPRVPFLLGYGPLPNLVTLGPQNIKAQIRKSLWCNHHALCYASMLDYAAGSAVVSTDAPYVACILGTV